MTIEEYKALNAKQQEAMVRLQERSGIEWGRFLENALAPGGIQDYVWIPDFHGMGVGIENDGYAHS